MANYGIPHSVRPQAEERAAELIASRRFVSVKKIPLPNDVTPLERLLIATHSELNSHEQAKLLGVKRGVVEYWRKGLRRRGLISRELRAYNAPITDREIDAVARLWRDGWSIRGIARSRDVNEIRVRRALQRAGVTPATPRRQWLSSQDVAAICNVSRETVCAWVALGWLPDMRDHAVSGASHLFAMDDLASLARNRATWFAWEPAQIDEPTLRALAEQERRAAGGAWRSMGEIAQSLGLPLQTLSTWRTRHGLFEGLEIQPHIGAKYVWLTDQQQVELQTWGASLRGPRVGNTPYRAAATALKHRLIAAYGRPRAALAAAEKVAAGEAERAAGKAKKGKKR